MAGGTSMLPAQFQVMGPSPYESTSPEVQQSTAQSDVTRARQRLQQAQANVARADATTVQSRLEGDPYANSVARQKEVEAQIMKERADARAEERSAAQDLQASSKAAGGGQMTPYQTYQVGRNAQQDDRQTARDNATDARTRYNEAISGMNLLLKQKQQQITEQSAQMRAQGTGNNTALRWSQEQNSQLLDWYQKRLSWLHTTIVSPMEHSIGLLNNQYTTQMQNAAHVYGSELQSATSQQNNRMSNEASLARTFATGFVNLAKEAVPEEQMRGLIVAIKAKARKAGVNLSDWDPLPHMQRVNVPSDPVTAALQGAQAYAQMQAGRPWVGTPNPQLQQPQAPDVMNTDRMDFYQQLAGQPPEPQLMSLGQVQQAGSYLAQPGMAQPSEPTTYSDDYTYGVTPIPPMTDVGQTWAPWDEQSQRFGADE